MPSAEQREAARLFQVMQQGGAQAVDAPVLLPSETLLDLYGEDLRARAYVTNDPEQGEMMMRPDFTVPVVQMHMNDGADPARYTYQGQVFRKQDPGALRAREYWQVGLELFDRENPAASEADVYCTVRAALGDLPFTVETGDMGVLLAAVQGLDTSARRCAALTRHVWRPDRFQTLFDRFCGRGDDQVQRTELAELAAEDVPARIQAAGPQIGLRSSAEIAGRVAVLAEDANVAPIPAQQAQMLEDLFNLRDTSVAALARLRQIAQDLPTISPALDRMEARLDALSDAGIDVAQLSFDAGYGRHAMEYYDGFVFGFYAKDRPELPPLSTGGRYDALTRVLGQGREIPAVGAVIRPGVVTLIRGEA